MEENVTRFSIVVRPRCKDCGSEDVFVPEPENGPGSLTCNACGADLGTLATLDENVMKDLDKLVLEPIDTAIRKAFEGSPNVRISKRS